LIDLEKSAMSTSNSDPDASLDDLPDHLSGFMDIGRDEDFMTKQQLEDYREIFVEASQARGSFVVEVQSSAWPSPQLFSFNQPFITIGRNPQVDLHLDYSEQVRLRHAYLQIIEGQLFCLSLSGQSMVEWEDGPRPWGWVAPNETIAIGPYRLRVVSGLDEDRTPPCPDPMAGGSAQHCPKARFEFHQNERTVTYWTLDRLLTMVGRSSICRIRTKDDNNGSHFQAALINTSRGLFIVDLGAKYGVRLGTKRTRYLLAQDDDMISIGKQRFRVNYFAPGEGQSFLSNETPSTVSTYLPQQERAVQRIIPYPVPVQGIPDTSGVVAANTFSNDLIKSMVEQFQQSQSLMLETFQQTMLSVMQSFGQIQADNMRSMQEELARLRELNNELAQVQTSLAQIARERASGELMTKMPNTPGTLGKLFLAAGDPSLRQSAPKERAYVHQTSAPETPKEMGEDPHHWLQSRLEALNQERASIWTRLSSVFGSAVPS
jgi:hypothetical protein